MMKIKTYMVICRDHSADLAEDVNEAIGNGWIPIGGVAVCVQRLEHDDYAETDWTFAQAMVREEER